MKIGIDLGTTNSALAWMDSDDDDQVISVLDIPQFVAQGREDRLRTLPSFLYLGDQTYVGAYAREQGALTPTRTVHSAKSWLSNGDVDRRAKILPWDTQEAARELSPVEVSAAYIRHMRKAWDDANPQHPLAEQDIVLTVPASFDEEARELTVEAAREAGLDRVTLLEEPAAAFYSWIANHLAESQKTLFDGQTVLVCDVGGGTSDFTLIKVSRKGDMVEFTRTAVGKHLLLGGDNLDLTLAWLVEAKLGQSLSLRQRSALRRQCAAAKERMLNNPAIEKVEITVLGSGSSLIGGTLRTEITRAEALELALDGFLPKCALTDRPNDDKRSIFRELGLPYVSDPAVTKHLAAFLAGAGDVVPDAILFNGGFFIPEILRQRVADVLESWYGKRPAIFENRDLDLAVAVGAAYYANAKTTGTGVLVRGGLPRAYFIGIGEGADPVKTVCLAPRGAEEGSSLELDMEGLQLVANKPVSFRLYSSLTRTEDKLGDIVEFPAEAVESGELHAHAPLNALIRFGKPQGERFVPVKLGATLTAVGTLEIYCDSKISDNRWRLQFELRKAKAKSAVTRRAAAVISEEARAAALALVESVFAPSGTAAPGELPGQLEQTLGLGRLSWPLDLIRALGDKFLELSDGRKKSAQHEARWLNLCGLCLRPGFGYPGDDLRIEQARRVYASGMAFGNQVQVEIEWYIFWGRVAGGLNKNQQSDIYQRIAQFLLPKGNKKVQRINSSLQREMWRTASSLEFLPSGTRTELGDALVRRLRNGEGAASELWCIARLGSRRLFYGPINQVLAASTAARWIESLAKIPNAAETLARLAQKTGNVTLDVNAQTANLVRKLAAGDADIEALLDGESQGDMDRIFGEELPGGLVLGTE
ncbi:MAG TPA: Hsp70 family protein [Bryobacteraceae bacterium]|nr:Hsp70 family protein [Bryobacteraceae bacterium]